jgi:hypothetical protein
VQVLVLVKRFEKLTFGIVKYNRRHCSLGFHLYPELRAIVQDYEFKLSKQYLPALPAQFLEPLYAKKIRA